MIAFVLNTVFVVPYDATISLLALQRIHKDLRSRLIGEFYLGEERVGNHLGSVAYREGGRGSDHTLFKHFHVQLTENII